MSKYDLFFKPIKTITLITGLQTFLFGIFINFSNHNAVLADINPFKEDPFKAIGYFGVQLAIAAALIALLRTVRPYPGGIRLKNLLLILNCDLTAILAILVTLSADSVALIRFYPKWIDLSAGWLLAAITCVMLAGTTYIIQRILYLGWSLNWFTKLRKWRGTLVVSLISMMILASYLPAWRRGLAGGIIAAVLGLVMFFVITALSIRMIFPEVRTPYEDLGDDLEACYQWIKQHTMSLKSYYRRMEHFFKRRKVQALIQSLNPRNHPWRLIVLLTFIITTIILQIEFLSESSQRKNNRLFVFSVYTAIEPFGVLLGYKLFRKFMGLFHT